ncbi:MAG: hypothetical protein K9I85_14425 [Saprospiraceae bacterium]|nr:hypothetical protein [Saprospiraceae bacterium]
MTGLKQRRIYIVFLLFVMGCLYFSATAQKLPGYSSTVESDEDLIILRIQALPQTATRYHYSETDRKTTNGPAFMNVRIEDEFSLVPVSFSEDVLGVKFQQGNEMWKRIFIMEEGLPEKWNELIWPELLLSVDAGTGRISLMNGSEVRPFITARLEELDHQVKTVESLKNLTFMMDRLRTMVANDENLCYWLTQPLQFMGHGREIEIPQSPEADLTQIMINPEKSDTLQRTYRVTRVKESGNQIRYTREGLNMLPVLGHKKANSDLISTPMTASTEEWVVDAQDQLIEVSRQSTTISESALNPLTIESSMRIVRLND